MGIATSPPNCDKGSIDALSTSKEGQEKGRTEVYYFRRLTLVKKVRLLPPLPPYKMSARDARLAAVDTQTNRGRGMPLVRSLYIGVEASTKKSAVHNEISPSDV